LEDPGLYGILKKWGWGVRTGLIWLRIGSGGGHLWMRYWTLGFQKMRGISWVAEDLLVSPEGLATRS